MIRYMSVMFSWPDSSSTTVKLLEVVSGTYGKGVDSSGTAVWSKARAFDRNYAYPNNAQYYYSYTGDSNYYDPNGSAVGVDVRFQTSSGWSKILAIRKGTYNFDITGAR